MVITITVKDGEGNTLCENKLEEEHGYWCDSCGEMVSDPEPAYECSACGEEFTRSNSADGMSHRCPQCSKFGSKTIEQACVECGTEVMETDVVVCPICEDGVMVEEFGSHYENCRG